MSTSATTPIDSLPQDPLARYRHYTTRARERLGQQRGCSELIFDIGRDMLLAIQTGEWTQAMSPAQRKKPTREKWAREVLDLTARQARKYFAVGEFLQREQVAGTGLCLERMYQVAQAPDVMQPLLIGLGKEGLTHAALSRGRREALPLLSTEEAAQVLRGPAPESHPLVVEALKVAERAARAADRKEEREDDAKEKEPGDDKGPETEGDRACRLLDRALDAVAELEDLPAARLTSEQLQRLLELKEEVIERVDELAARASLGDETRAEAKAEGSFRFPGQGGPDEAQMPPGGEDSQAAAPLTSPPEPHAEPSASASAPSPAGKGMDFKPLLEAAQKALTYHDQGLLEVLLYQVASGHPVKNVLPDLSVLCRTLVNAGSPRELGERWLSLLGDPDAERRGAFALWFYRRSRLPSFHIHLGMLRTQDLPPSLRQQVETLWAAPAADPAQGKVCTPAKSVGEPANGSS